MGQGNSVRRCPFLSMTTNTSQLLLPAKCHLGTRPNNEWLSDPNYTCKLGESLKWHVFTLHLLMAREKKVFYSYQWLLGWVYNFYTREIIFKPIGLMTNSWLHHTYQWLSQCWLCHSHLESWNNICHSPDQARMEFLKIINGQINIAYKYGKMHTYLYHGVKSKLTI